MAQDSEIFLSCDWGTTSFRLRMVSREKGEIIDQAITETGVKKIAQSLPTDATAPERAQAFHDYLVGQVTGILDRAGRRITPTAMVVSGMASSSVGWKELPYAALPFPVDGSGTQTQWLELNLPESDKLSVLLVSGVATETEMMRGEETQLIGLFAHPTRKSLAQNSLVVLPGTHTKYIRIKDGQAVELQTYMTGELFQVLSDHSILKFTTATETDTLDNESFRKGIKAAKNPGISRSLFQVRTRGVLEGGSNDSNRSYLSGLLLGAECTDLDPRDNQAPVLVAANGHMTKLYQSASEILEWQRPLIVADEDELNQAVVEGHRLYLKCHSQPSRPTKN